MRGKSSLLFLQEERDASYRVWGGGVSPEELSDSTREPSTCTVANLLTLAPNSRPRLSSKRRPFEPSREVEGLPMPLALADARHARIRRLAPCLRRHLPGDGWFEFVRRASIDESPRIPESLQGKNGLSNVSPSISPIKGRSSARSFPDLRYFSLDLLAVARRERTWTKFKLRTPCTDLWLRAHIPESFKSNLRWRGTLLTRNVIFSRPEYMIFLD